jgi:ComF family protein
MVTPAPTAYAVRVAILDLLLALLYPPRCPSCARDVQSAGREGLCRGCLARLGTLGDGCPLCGEPGRDAPCARCRAAPPPFRAARACFAYVEGDLAATLLMRWKYHQDHVVGSSLCRVLRTHRQRHPECYDVIVPVPLHRARLAARGFNQAALLARFACLPAERLAVDALRRTRSARVQARLGRRERLDNVATAFDVRRRDLVQDRSVLLVDDVLTTGATARACAGVLRDAGAALVDVWTLARTPGRARRAPEATLPGAGVHP